MQALSLEEDAEVVYVTDPRKLDAADIIILPGTKNTIADLKYLRESGMAERIVRMAKKGTPVFGICGGLQMLGDKITDAAGAENESVTTAEGLGLLKMNTEFAEKKQQKQVDITLSGCHGIWDALNDKRVRGYEIHAGISAGEDISYSLSVYCRENVAGTYVHGIFDESEVRNAFLDIAALKRGISRSDIKHISYDEYRDEQLDILAEAVRNALDMKAVYGLLENEPAEGPEVDKTASEKAAAEKAAAEKAAAEKAASEQTAAETIATEVSEIDYIKPAEIEGHSMEIIEETLREMYPDFDCRFQKEQLPVIKRAIHTSADFDYAQNLVFSDNAIEDFTRLLKEGVTIITDTRMGFSGINKKNLAKLGCAADCFMDSEDVAKEATKREITRAIVSVEKAARLDTDVIYVVGNAPTALIRIHELFMKNECKNIKAVIAVPVGFVNVVEAKELILNLPVPYIVARGRKGGSNVAAAIVNALLMISGGPKH